MRETVSIVSLTASGLMAFALVASVFLSTDGALAGDPDTAANEARSPSCSCPGASQSRQKPKFAAAPESSIPLDTSDEVAVLSSVQHALTATADGATYVWHRDNGRISGLVQPTSSFKNVEGGICRHVVLLLTTGSKTRKTEGVACRLQNGVWSLEG